MIGCFPEIRIVFLNTLFLCWPQEEVRVSIYLIWELHELKLTYCRVVLRGCCKIYLMKIGKESQIKREEEYKVKGKYKIK